MPSMIQIIKQAAIEAVEASKPAKVVYGTVISTSPLSIKLDQKFTIPAEFIVLTERIAGEVFFIGDKVIMLQEQGGQRYVLLDKVGG